MSVITKDFLKKKESIIRTSGRYEASLVKSYLANAEKQGNEKVVWFMKVIMVIPCVLMVPSIIFMSMITTSYIWFVGVTMALFFLNVIAHIGEIESKIYIPLYHATILLIILLPLITYIITL